MENNIEDNILLKKNQIARKDTARKKSVIERILYTDEFESTEEENLNRMRSSETKTIEGDTITSVAEKKEEKREQWNSFMEYFLSIIGFVIDLGNVWRFPTVCYQNGGGAFLIPFLICLFIIGMPCMYLELAAGQYFQSGNITIWAKMSPYMKGIGYTVVIINILMLSYYNTLQSYALYYLVYSFQSPVPWSACDRSWNTKQCHIRDITGNRSIAHNHNTSIDTNATTQNDVYLPATEFFSRKLLGSHLSRGFDHLSGMKFDMLLSVFAIFILTTGCLIKGIKTSGKAVYVTALLPYVCLAVLIGQSIFLDGSYEGLAYYLTPKFDKIFELKVWLAAAVQTFFSLGPGFGVLITYASYTKKNTNIRNLTIMCSVVNCCTSLLYGVVVFAGLGYMAKRLNVDINFFLRDGIGLVYVVYPEIIATFKGAFIFAIVFFVMLITLGMDSAFGGMEGLYTAIVDEYPSLKKHALITRVVISGIPFITCLPTVTYAGIYVVQWLDTFAISPSVLLVVFTEVVTVSWFYGSDKFCSHIKEMNGIWPYVNWRASWKFICPISLLTIVILDVTFFEGLNYGSYAFPKWSVVLGYAINVIALLPIPGYAIYKLIRVKFLDADKYSL